MRLAPRRALTSVDGFDGVFAFEARCFIDESFHNRTHGGALGAIWSKQS